jgi:hypothetical protein
VQAQSIVGVAGMIKNIVSLRIAVLTLIATVGCLCGQKYPQHWWTPVPEANKPDWEILPQAAKPSEVILSKRNELGILSNFAPTPFTLYGKRYASSKDFGR